MWKNVEIETGQNILNVSNANNNYSYKAFFDILLNEDRLAKVGHLRWTNGWFQDVSDFDATKAPVSSNTGLKERWEHFMADDKVPKKHVVLRGPLLSDIWMQPHFILNALNLTVKLTPNDDKFRTMQHPVNLKAKLHINEIYINLCKITLTQDALESVANGLSRVPIQYPVVKTDVRQFSVPRNASNADFPNIYSGEVPSKMVIGFVSQTAYNGSYTKNPFYFQNLNIIELGLYINDEAVSHRPYTTDFPNNSFFQPLFNLLKLTSENGKPQNLAIRPEDFKSGLSLFTFDVDPTVNASLKQWPMPKSGTVRITVRFGTQVSDSMNMLVYGIFPGNVEIDSKRNVLPVNIHGSALISSSETPEKVPSSKGRKKRHAHSGNSKGRKHSKRSGKKK